MYFKETEFNINKMMGYLDFNLIDIEFRVEISKNQVRRLILSPKGNKKEFIFKSYDRVNKDLSSWQKKINEVIEATKHKEKSI